VGVRAIESDARGGEPIQVRGGASFITVRADGVRPKRVDRDQEDMSRALRRYGERRFRAADH
jgi:hypothetical protein